MVCVFIHLSIYLSVYHIFVLIIHSNYIAAEFCKEFYLNIKKLNNGHIIWTYMKPLIRGKILYAPQTPDSEAIMSEVNVINIFMSCALLIHSLSNSCVPYIVDVYDA